MNYKSITLPTEAPFPIEIIKHDKTIKAVVFNGLRIEGQYGLSVMVEQPFEEVSRHRVTASIEGFGTKVLHFNSRYDGSEEIAALEAAGATIEREDVKVLVDERGEVVSEAKKPADNGSDIPF